MTQGRHIFYLVRSKPHSSCYACETIKGRWTVFCSSKTEGCMIGYLSMTQGGHGYFCVGMTSLPADDAMEAFFIASNGRLGARWHLRSSHGRKPSRFVLNIECCLGARKHRGEAPNSMNMLPRSLTWCIASLTAHVLHVKLLKEDGFFDVSSHGSPDSFTPRIPLSRYSGNPNASQRLRRTWGS